MTGTTRCRLGLICACLLFMQGCQLVAEPVASPPPTSPLPSLPAGTYGITLTAENVSTCATDCYSEQVTADVGQQVRFRVAVALPERLSFFVEGPNVRVHLPFEPSTSAFPEALLYAQGNPLRSEIHLTTAVPSLLAYVRNSTNFATAELNPFLLGDQSGTSVLLLNQGFNVPSTKQLVTTVYLFLEVRVVGSPPSPTV